MRITKIIAKEFSGIDLSRLKYTSPKRIRQNRFMHDACFKLGSSLGVPTEQLLKLTQTADIDQFNFLRAMINRFNTNSFIRHENDSEHILKIYSAVKRPTPMHINIVNKSNSSFDILNKIFVSAKTEKSLEFVQNMQQDALKESSNPLTIISDLLDSKYNNLYINKPQNYESYLRLHADDINAVKKLDSLIDTGKYSRFRFDAQLAVKKLMKKKKIEVAMAGKTNELEFMYSKDRANFLSSLINSFVPTKKAPKEETKATVVKMYGTLNSTNAKLRNDIVDRFKSEPVGDKTAEIIEMQKLFNRIDHDKDAREFVQKTISKDLKISSIAELNEIMESAPLKKANIFFNNAKRIIEKASGEERKKALIVELENPFFEPKMPKTGKARIVRMFADKPQKDDFFTKAYKIIENKINQYRYSRMSA